MFCSFEARCGAFLEEDAGSATGVRLMQRIITISLLILMAVAYSPPATATPALAEWGLNIDGTTYLTVGTLPPEVDHSAFNFSTGLGVLKLQITGPVLAIFYVDIELDEDTTTFFNEYGEKFGSAPGGLSWEIDEPGWVYGDIFTNLLNGALDNTNGVPIDAPDDVSLAIGWALAGTDVATIHWRVSDIPPKAGFYLKQTDPASGSAVYMYGDASTGPQGIPEPGTLPLVLAGLGLMAAGIRSLRQK